MTEPTAQPGQASNLQPEPSPPVAPAPPVEPAAPPAPATEAERRQKSIEAANAAVEPPPETPPEPPAPAEDYEAKYAQLGTHYGKLEQRLRNIEKQTLPELQAQADELLTLKQRLASPPESCIIWAMASSEIESPISPSPRSLSSSAFVMIVFRLSGDNGSSA